MPSIIDFINDSVFSGLPGSLAWELLKTAWERVNQKAWEEYYLDAFQSALIKIQPAAKKLYVEDLTLSRDDLRRILHEDLKIDVEAKSLQALSTSNYSSKLANTLADNHLLGIGERNISVEEYQRLLDQLVESAHANFRETIIGNELIFRQAVMKSAQDEFNISIQLSNFLSKHFDLTFDKLENLEIKSVQQLDELNTIRRIVSSIHEQVQVADEVGITPIAENLSRPPSNLSFSGNPEYEKVVGEGSKINLPDLMNRVRQALLDLRYPFDSSQRLSTIFGDPRLKEWRPSLPESNTISDRIDGTLDYLFGERTPQGKPVLAVLLRVISERVNPSRDNHHRLLRLADELEHMEE